MNRPVSSSNASPPYASAMQTVLQDNNMRNSIGACVGVSALTWRTLADNWREFCHLPQVRKCYEELRSIQVSYNKSAKELARAGKIVDIITEFFGEVDDDDPAVKEITRAVLATAGLGYSLLIAGSLLCEKVTGPWWDSQCTLPMEHVMDKYAFIYPAMGIWGVATGRIIIKKIRAFAESNHSSKAKAHIDILNEKFLVESRLDVLKIELNPKLRLVRPLTQTCALAARR